jgi:biotin carboxyl carrier protein
MNCDYVRTIIRILEESKSDIESLEVRTLFYRVKATRSVIAGPRKTIERRVEVLVSGDKAPTYHEIRSEMVGTFYWNEDKSGRRPKVRKKRAVEKDQVLGYIEALKLMNPVKSLCEGRIVNVYVKNGEPIEFGQLLFELDKIQGQ